MSSSLPNEQGSKQGAQRGAQAHNPEITALTETKSQTHNQLSYLHAPKAQTLYQPPLFLQFASFQNGPIVPTVVLTFLLPAP